MIHARLVHYFSWSALVSFVDIHYFRGAQFAHSLCAVLVEIPLSEDDVRTALAPLMKFLPTPPRFMGLDSNYPLCLAGRGPRFQKNVRPSVQRAIVYLPLSHTASDISAERFMISLNLGLLVNSRGPNSEVGGYSIEKALGEVEYQGQMCQAIVVFVTWGETDAELVKQKSFKADYGSACNKVARREVGIEEQTCKFCFVSFVQA